MLWKEKNSKVFDIEVSSIIRLKDKWLHYFGFILLEHDIIEDVDFGIVIDSLTLI